MIGKLSEVIIKVTIASLVGKYISHEVLRRKLAFLKIPWGIL